MKNVNMEKICAKCKDKKDISLFPKNKNNKDGYHHYCKKCKNNDSKKRYATNFEYRENLKNNAILRKYNITKHDFLNKIKSQDYKCEICEIKICDENNNIRIDHNHITGNVRGILCPKCNLMLGLVNDDITILKNIIDYIEKYD
jgi:hypothetical protein